MGEFFGLVAESLGLGLGLHGSFSAQPPFKV
jgi:hypothetical protein